MANPVLDVRSPAEYKQAHIPGAYSLPLFSDEERKVVGTAYKQQSRETAIKIGLDFFGPKMRKMIEEVQDLVNNWRASGNGSPTAMSDNRTIKETEKTQRPSSSCILVHCWRGGMRSAGIAWLLDLYGYKVYTLIGGYKTYRNYVLETFQKPYEFKILGGYTGSGKTIVLKELEKNGENTIDLESIASHKGSAFGALGEPVQPSQEMFENLLSRALTKNTDGFSTNAKSYIWLEDESQRIGLINIHHAIWSRMRQSPVYFMDIPFEERLNFLVESYGKHDKEKMVNAIIRIRKRLGGLETKTAIHFLLEDNMNECFRILLKYYDKYYLKGLNNREHGHTLITAILCEKVNAKANAKKILTMEKSLIASNFLNDE